MHCMDLLYIAWCHEAKALNLMAPEGGRPLVPLVADVTEVEVTVSGSTCTVGDAVGRPKT